MSNILEAIVMLINELEHLGAINKVDLISALVEEIDVIAIRKYSTYEEVARLIDEGKSVFLEIDRRKAYYANKRLSKILGRPVKRYRAEYMGRKGYIFTV